MTPVMVFPLVEKPASPAWRTTSSIPDAVSGYTINTRPSVFKRAGGDTFTSRINTWLSSFCSIDSPGISQFMVNPVALTTMIMSFFSSELLPYEFITVRVTV